MMAASKHIVLRISIRLDRLGHSSLTVLGKYVQENDDRREDVTPQLHSSCSKHIELGLLYSVSNGVVVCAVSVRF